MAQELRELTIEEVGEFSLANLELLLETATSVDDVSRMMVPTCAV